MRVHVLQHVPFEGLGSIATWLAQRNAQITWTRLFETAEFPNPGDIDLVIALGGPMSVNDHGDYPWLQAEKDFVAHVMASNVPMLGICLGSQLIASALGTSVYASADKEIGWFPIHREPAGRGCFAFPETVEAFHWHGETYDLPAGAVRLARSEACLNQAFQVGRRVMGLQLHLETTPESAAALIEHCADELVPGRYIQMVSELRTVPDTCYGGINVLMAQVLDYLVGARE